MADHPVSFADLKVGMQVTFRSTYGKNKGCGQGGTIVDVNEHRAHLLCGTAQIEMSIDFADWDEVYEERPLPAEDCVSFHEGNCSGPVEWCPAPSGSPVQRCEHHNDERWERYEKSETERYADSDAAPSWFDPADIGEHWDTDY